MLVINTTTTEILVKILGIKLIALANITSLILIALTKLENEIIFALKKRRKTIWWTRNTRLPVVFCQSKQILRLGEQFLASLLVDLHDHYCWMLGQTFSQIFFTNFQFENEPKNKSSK